MSRNKVDELAQTVENSPDVETELKAPLSTTSASHEQSSNASVLTEKEKHALISWASAAVAEHYLSQLTESVYSQPQPPPEAVAERVQQESFLVQNGVQYMPLSDAARLAGVQRETLLSWMKNEVKFDGEPIDAVYFKPTGNHFVSMKSVERIANRFIRWPSKEPAGIVIIGETDDQTGYLPTSDAARIIRMADPTLRAWVRLNKTPLDKPLNVIKCTTSGYFYIHHKDVLRLAKHVKEHGVPRGPRRQKSIEP